MRDMRYLLLPWVLAIGLAGRAEAATLSLVPQTSNFDSVVTGDILVLDIVMDFTGEPTFGGGFSVTYDPGALEFVSYWRDETIGDPEWNRLPDIYEDQGLLDTWAVGSFDGLPEVATLGSVTFVVLPTMGDDTDVKINDAGDPGCSWVNFSDPSQCSDIYYGNVTVNRIPIPAAGWLMMSAVTFLWALRR